MPDGKKDSKKQRTCPVCESPDIVPYVGFKCGMLWHCKKCGYVGALVIERG